MPEYQGDSVIPIALKIVESTPGDVTTTINIWSEALARRKDGLLAVIPEKIVFVECQKRCPMIQTVEAAIDAAGPVYLLGEIQGGCSRRAFVTVLEEPATIPGEAALLAEAALAVDWSRPEEDAAWSHLQQVK